MTQARRPRSFYVLAAVFAAFVLFLYGPMSTIVILSFQGPEGGLTFPMNGVSIHWIANLFERQAVGDFGGSFSRSLTLALGVAALTVMIATLASYAFRRRFTGAALVFYLAIASLIVPSILVSLGIGLMFRIMDWQPAWYSSGLGAHLTWTLPIGLLIMFAVFNRFDRSWEEAARDLGASPWQTFRHVVLPIIGPSIAGLFVFSFTLSYDEFARTLMTAGSFNTLPLEIYAMTTNVTTPVLYAIGTLTTGFSIAVVMTGLGVTALLRARAARRSGRQPG
jgi:putative spermidine/putrescine transport system permease protein